MLPYKLSVLKSSLDSEIYRGTYELLCVSSSYRRSYLCLHFMRTSFQSCSSRSVNRRGRSMSLYFIYFKFEKVILSFLDMMSFPHFKFISWYAPHNLFFLSLCLCVLLSLFFFLSLFYSLSLSFYLSISLSPSLFNFSIYQTICLTLWEFPLESRYIRLKVMKMDMKKNTLLKASN